MALFQFYCQRLRMLNWSSTTGDTHNASTTAASHLGVRSLPCLWIKCWTLKWLEHFLASRGPSTIGDSTSVRAWALVLDLTETFACKTCGWPQPASLIQVSLWGCMRGFPHSMSCRISLVTCNWLNSRKSRLFALYRCFYLDPLSATLYIALTKAWLEWIRVASEVF